jgi:hypothetical protein
LPEVVEEIDDWNEAERLDYIYEWSLEKERLKQLDELRWTFQMTSEQRERYFRLQELVNANGRYAKKIEELAR